MTEVRLYGSLGKDFGREWRLRVKNPAEVIGAIDALRPGFRKAILDLRDFDFHVQVGERSIGEDRLAFPNRGRVVSITPILRGSDTKGIITLIAGIVLIAVGLYFHITPLAQLGLALALGGVASLLTGNPANPDSGVDNKHKASYQFQSAINTIEQGLPVPILIGEGFQGSAVVSAGIFSIDITQGSIGGGFQGGGVPPIIGDHDEP